jgi:hypothetical protein
MATGLALAAVVAAALLPGAMGRAKAKVKFTSILAKSPVINALSAARMFLFGARDVWFVVALPVFLYDVAGWSFVGVGSYMAAWVIGYGGVQALTPRVIDRSSASPSNHARAAQLWGCGLALIPVALLVALRAGASPTLAVVIGLGVFGVAFAVNSALHSYLILAYADADRVSLDVGFYYMANAGGRLIGTVLSGLIYQLAGLAGCLLASAAMVAIASALALLLPDPRRADQVSP